MPNVNMHQPREDQPASVFHDARPDRLDAVAAIRAGTATILAASHELAPTIEVLKP